MTVYALRFWTNDKHEARPGITCGTWQGAYKLARRVLYDLPHDVSDPVITAAVVRVTPDGTCTRVAEFQVQDGRAVRTMWT